MRDAERRVSLRALGYAAVPPEMTSLTAVLYSDARLAGESSSLDDERAGSIDRREAGRESVG